MKLEVDDIGAAGSRIRLTFESCSTLAELERNRDVWVPHLATALAGVAIFTAPAELAMRVGGVLELTVARIPGVDSARVAAALLPLVPAAPAHSDTQE